MFSSKCYLFIFGLACIVLQAVDGCLITNCPRGGKRNGKFLPDNSIKPCISCGPGHSGQCFGPDICCGPFGCLLSTHETARCRREGNFQETEPCIAGNASCRRNSGRCAADGICCSQDSCFADKSCALDTNVRYDFYAFVNPEYAV